MNDCITRKQLISIGALASINMLRPINRAYASGTSVSPSSEKLPRLRIKLSVHHTNGNLTEPLINDTVGISELLSSTSPFPTEDGYFELHFEGPENSSVIAAMDFCFEWADDHTRARIVKGVFSLTQTDPFVSFSDAYYNLYQKDKYIRSSFNGQQTSVKTNWDFDTYDALEDIWSYGAMVGAKTFSLYTGEESEFALEICLE